MRLIPYKGSGGWLITDNDPDGHEDMCGSGARRVRNGEYDIIAFDVLSTERDKIRHIMDNKYPDVNYVFKNGAHYYVGKKTNVNTNH